MSGKARQGKVRYLRDKGKAKLFLRTPASMSMKDEGDGGWGMWVTSYACIIDQLAKSDQIPRGKRHGD